MVFETKFVAVGGRSGVGKTTLVNQLLKMYPMRFKRPLSYTTREKRMGENENEYCFVSHSKMLTLYKQGKLANIDFNYNNFYAMDLPMLMKDMQIGNRMLIKEIHPKYYGNIRKILGGAMISVVIEGVTIANDRKRRNKDDDIFFENLNSEDVDVKYYYDRTKNVEDCTRDLYKRIMQVIECDY